MFSPTQISFAALNAPKKSFTLVLALSSMAAPLTFSEGNEEGSKESPASQIDSHIEDFDSAFSTSHLEMEVHETALKEAKRDLKVSATNKIIYDRINTAYQSLKTLNSTFSLPSLKAHKNENSFLYNFNNDDVAELFGLAFNANNHDQKGLSSLELSLKGTTGKQSGKIKKTTVPVKLELKITEDNEVEEIVLDKGWGYIDGLRIIRETGFRESQLGLFEAMHLFGHTIESPNRYRVNYDPNLVLKINLKGQYIQLGTWKDDQDKTEGTLFSQDMQLLPDHRYNIKAAQRFIGYLLRLIDDSEVNDQLTETQSKKARYILEMAVIALSGLDAVRIQNRGGVANYSAYTWRQSFFNSSDAIVRLPNAMPEDE